MPFSATINLGTVGVAITSVKLYGCTGTSGGNCTGCTALTGYENVSVSTFPLLVSGIPNGVTYIQAEALGACSADLVKQCISISGIPAPTSTPAPTATLNGATPGPTATQTPTPTPTPSQSAGPCGAPTISNVTRSGLNDIVVSFTTSAGCVATHLEYSFNNSTWSSQNSGGCTSPRTITLSPNNQGTVYVRMRQSCVGVEYSSYSSTFTLSNLPPATQTPTPTPTVTLPGCGSTVSGTFTGSTGNNYDDIQLNFAGVANGSIINFTCTANDRPNNISIRTSLTVLESTGWFGNSSGYNSEEYYYPTEMGPITLSIVYDNTKTYYIDVLTAPALEAPNEVNDFWEVSIQCLGVPSATMTPTPSSTTPPLYGRFKSNPKTLSTGHCNDNQLTSGLFYSTSSTITNMLGTTVYTDTEYTVFNGGGFYYAVSSDNTFNTNNPPYWVMLVDAYGEVTDMQYIANCSGNGGNV